ncbi:hypothetical protein DH2020_015658 [Rehmannia glutinosa]|uniref:SFR19-like C-terminal domain-containing protein n=1 Tax=Rehmannia glutinosa TaxID=99300 RepID=A0ABR0WTU5_REHGL
MSPGLDRSRSRRGDPRYGQREGLPVERENAQGQVPLERVDKIDKSSTIDHDKKAIQSFKFRLADYVKDILNPYWEAGTISREAYKTIVKKSVSKVLASFKDSHIPTAGRIDAYLKSSHLKLSKLVLAYVEKHRKRSVSKTESSV